MPQQTQGLACSGDVANFGINRHFARLESQAGGWRIIGWDWLTVVELILGIQGNEPICYNLLRCDWVDHDMLREGWGFDPPMATGILVCLWNRDECRVIAHELTTGDGLYIRQWESNAEWLANELGMRCSRANVAWYLP